MKDMNIVIIINELELPKMVLINYIFMLPTCNTLLEKAATRFTFISFFMALRRSPINISACKTGWQVIGQCYEGKPMVHTRGRYISVLSGDI